ncbi:MAG: exopolysaccharide biosynthesis polyprenyl glycosylphosphotransferase [Rhodocyclaceae bacterium]|nr:exopolysaccharide biosynthesis polyprenyl glycosylphosphotransferase [Rhodocyclaceae bacterium]
MNEVMRRESIQATDSAVAGSQSGGRAERAKHVDMASRVAVERLALRAAHAGCALGAVGVLAALDAVVEHSGVGPLGSWWVFLPFMSFLAPVRGYAGFSDPRVAGVLRAISALLNAMLVVLGLQVLFALAGQPTLELLFAALLVLMHSALSLAARTLLERRARRHRRKVRLVIVGAGEQGIATARDIAENEPEVEIAGFVDDRESRIDRENLPAPFLGKTSDPSWRSRGVDGVVIALPSGAVERIHALTILLREDAGSVYLAPELPVLQLPVTKRSNAAPHNLRLLGMSSLPLEGRIAKRVFDIVFSTLALITFLPAGLVIAALIRLESPGPVLFRQKRYGSGGGLFDVFKFRSMIYSEPSGPGEIRLTERDDRRVTRLGAFLRRTSLDEFPQFFNVLRGEMSVVGPRPHPPGVKAGERMYEEVVEAFAERYKVRPGITGWAQVNGLRGNTFTERHLTERFAYDIEYIQNWSFELDLWIVLRTAFGGFGGRNAF